MNYNRRWMDKSTDFVKGKKLTPIDNKFRQTFCTEKQMQDAKGIKFTAIISSLSSYAQVSTWKSGYISCSLAAMRYVRYRS